MVDGTAAPLLTAALAAFDLQGVLTSLATTAIVAAASAAAGVYVTVKVLAAKFADLADRVGHLETKAERSAAEAARLDKERLGCKLDAAREFASRHEVMAVNIRVAEDRQAVQDRLAETERRVLESLSEMDTRSEARSVAIHNRVNTVAEGLAKLEGQGRVKT